VTTRPLDSGVFYAPFHPTGQDQLFGRAGQAIMNAIQTHVQEKAEEKAEEKAV